MKSIILILSLIIIGCTTNIEFTEYKANALNIEGVVYITQTEHQLPSSLSLTFHQKIPNGEFGLIFDRSYSVIEITALHEGLCDGHLGC